MRNFVAANNFVDQRAPVIPAKTMQDRIGNAAGKPGVERDLYTPLFECGEDLFGMRESSQFFVAEIEGDHFVYKQGVDPVNEHLVVIMFGLSFSE